MAWDNAAHSLLERTLDDSASRRMILPQAFLTSDELVQRSHRILLGLLIHDEAVARNVAVYGTFAATERLLMELVRAGADRQEMHERIREHAMNAWQALWAGEPDLLVGVLTADSALLRYLPADCMRELLDASQHVGDTPERARGMASAIRRAVTLGATGSGESKSAGR